MKKILVLGLALFTISCGKNSAQSLQGSSQFLATEPSSEEIDTDEGVLSPEQEDQYFKTYFPGSEKARAYKFAQTSWQECTDLVTGNYTGAKCSSSRAISVILKKFMDEHMYKCVNEGLKAQGGGVVDDMHVVHAGIFGDPNHSPRSLHSENRAIDIKSFEVKLSSGAVKTFTFAGSTHRPFFQAFRTCWGNIVKAYNGCPLYKSTASLTASIGHEDKNHQYHMHTSVPYCLGGSYGPFYYQK